MVNRANVFKAIVIIVFVFILFELMYFLFKSNSEKNAIKVKSQNTNNENQHKKYESVKTQSVKKQTTNKPKTKKVRADSKVKTEKSEKVYLPKSTKVSETLQQKAVFETGIVRRPKGWDSMSSEEKWAHGMFGKSINNSVTTCKIPFGVWEHSDLKIPKYEKCEEPNFAFLRGKTKNILVVDPFCGEKEATKEEIEKELQRCFDENVDKTPPKLLDHSKKSTDCPIYYLLKDKYKEDPYYGEGHWYFGPTRIPDEDEWIVVTCKGRSNGLERMSVQNADNQAEPPEGFKPNLVVLLLDGISRTHFHRIMHHTESVLDRIHRQEPPFDSGYKVTEFFKYHAVDYSSNSNETPMWTGVDWWQYCRHKWKCDFMGSVPFKRFIWDWMQKGGYKTQFGVEQCWTRYSTDYMFSTKSWTNYFVFPLGHGTNYCMADLKPICLFGRRPQQILLSYMRKFYNYYRKYPKFLLNTFLEPHETSMKIISTADADFAQFIAELTQLKENTFIFVISDHGLHYGPFFDRTWTGRLEHKFPLLITLTPKQFQERYPEKFKNLEENAQKLVTPYDIYETWKEIANLDEEREDEEDEKHPKYGISLFEPIPEDRDCEEANIPPYMCMCGLKLTETPPGWRECGTGPLQQIC